MIKEQSRKIKQQATRSDSVTNPDLLTVKKIKGAACQRYVDGDVDVAVTLGVNRPSRCRPSKVTASLGADGPSYLMLDPGSGLCTLDFCHWSGPVFPLTSNRRQASILWHSNSYNARLYKLSIVPFFPPTTI